MRDATKTSREGTPPTPSPNSHYSVELYSEDKPAALLARLLRGPAAPP